MASLGLIAAGVGHEINNPLAAISANVAHVLDLLGDDPRAAIREALSDVHLAAERVRVIARDLLLFARHDDDQRVIDLHGVLTSTVRLCANDVRHRARLVTHIEPGLWVCGNGSRLGQVLLNLVINAAQAIAEGRAADNEINVVARAAKQQIVIEVKDSGPGIAPQHRDMIFEPFFTTKRDSGGTGLGLSVCARIVADHGGTIDIESAPGAGTTFRVLLPATQPPTPTLNAAEPLIHAPLRVLVVDDEPLVSTALRRMLAPHKATEVRCVDEALALLDAGERFDVVLCDLMMPDKTAEDLVNDINARHQHLQGRVVIVTGGAFTEHARDFLRNAASVLDKPFTRAQVHAAIAPFLRPPTPV
jgi:CheY-like chemotaxis protein/two-component sensor histidine kinase